MRRRIRGVTWSLLSLLLVVGSSSAIAASPAGAQALPHVADLTCAISATAHFSPGIGLLSHPQTVTGEVHGGTDFSPAPACTSLTGVPYQGFTLKLNGTGNMACSAEALKGGASGTAKVTWDNGDISTLDWSITTAAMVPVVKATVTHGPLTGANIAVAGAPDSLTGNCVVNPITGAGFAGVAEFAGLGG